MTPEERQTEKLLRHAANYGTGSPDAEAFLDQRLHRAVDRLWASFLPKHENPTPNKGGPQMTEFKIGDEIEFDWETARDGGGQKLYEEFRDGRATVIGFSRHTDSLEIRSSDGKRDFVQPQHVRLAGEPIPEPTHKLTLPDGLELSDPEDILSHFPRCQTFSLFFVDWMREVYKPWSDTLAEDDEDLEKRTLTWLLSKEQARDTLLEKGWLTKIEPEPKKDWSQLEINWKVDGCPRVYDRASGKYLLTFCKDGRVVRSGLAEGGYGSFDDDGRLIVE